MSNWEPFKIADICSNVTSGGTPKSTNPEYYENGTIPWLNTKEVNFNRIWSTEKQITEKALKESSAKWIPKNSVIVAMYGATAGRVAVSKIDLTTNQACCNLTIDDRKADYNFIYYFLSINTERLLDLANGAAQQNLNSLTIKGFEGNLPPLPEQKAIAHILGTLDDKIELNRQMNQTLEAMAQALFKSWFVDFDPVLDNALAAGNAIPEALEKKAAKRKLVDDSKKLLHSNPELASMFPSGFEWSEELEKWVPEGWEVKTLKEVTTELRRGISPKYTEVGGVRVLNQKCIRNHEIDFSLARRNDITQKKVDGRLLRPYDMLVNSTGTGTLGRVSNVIALDEDTVVDSHITVLRANESLVLKRFFNGLIFSIESLIEAMGEGSTGQTELSRARLGEVEILIPSIKVQAIADDLLDKNFKKKDKNNQESQILTQLRDTLLPQLISGKLTIL